MTHPYRKGDLVSIKARVMFDQNTDAKSDYVFIDIGLDGVYVPTKELELITPHLKIGDTVALPGGSDVAFVRGLASEQVWVQDAEGRFNTYHATKLRLSLPIETEHVPAP